MIRTQSRSAMLVGLGAAAGAFAAAVTLSGATAPGARADDLTDFLSGIEADFTDGQMAFSTAITDFGNADMPDGMAQFFMGLDDTLIGPPDSFTIGLAELLTSGKLDDVFTISLTPPLDFASALSEAQQAITTGQTDLGLVGTDLLSGDLLGAASNEALGSFAVFDLPAQLLLMGAIDQLVAP